MQSCAEVRYIYNYVIFSLKLNKFKKTILLCFQGLLVNFMVFKMSIKEGSDM